MHPREDAIRAKIDTLLVTAQNTYKKEGIEFRVVGSIGIYGLTGIEPVLIRGEVGGCISCVDIDYLLGLPPKFPLARLKMLTDTLWQQGMDGELKIPVSPVNLPKAIANDPQAVLPYSWTVGQGMSVPGLRRPIEETSLAPEWVCPRTVEFPTLSPSMYAAFLFFWKKSPRQFYKTLRQLRRLLQHYNDRPVLPETDQVVQKSNLFLARALLGLIGTVMD